jgi:beta-galactosidase GanA
MTSNRHAARGHAVEPPAERAVVAALGQMQHHLRARRHRLDGVVAGGEQPGEVVPAQQIDCKRFSSAEYLACYRLERDVLHELSPDVPVTTNFMATACPHIDYWRWADEVDVVTNDHYLIAEDPGSHVHRMTRGALTTKGPPGEAGPS